MQHRRQEHGIQHRLENPGTIPLEIQDWRSASRNGRYLNAFRNFAGDRAGPEVLKPFQGRSVTVNGKTYPFVTNPEVVMMLAAGEPPFQDVYVWTR